ncbi:MAG: tail fiber protein [Nocardioides sp.]
MAQPYVGEIRMFGGNFAPSGWQLCEGQLLAISEYDSLFALIGTSYGGNGSTTFALPDLRGRLPVHQGNGLLLAETGGAEEVTLTLPQIPTHTHSLAVAGDRAGTQTSPAGNLPARSFNVTPYLNEAPSASFSGSAITSVGGSQPHTNLQPYLCVHFIISLFGIFPSPT